MEQPENELPKQEPAIEPTEEPAPEPEAGPSLAPGAPSEIPEAPIKPESRFQSYLRSVWPWLLAILIFFILGGAAAYILFYQPAARKLAQAEIDLQQARQQSSDLQKQVDQLTPLQAQNQSLQKDNTSTHLHVVILSTLSDVLEARLSIANKNIAGAHTALKQTSDNLKTLTSLLDPNEQKVGTDMQTRLTLVLSELDSNSDNASADLDILAQNLIKLENQLYTTP